MDRARAQVELAGIADDGALEQHLRIFTAEPHASTNIERLAPSIWDLDEVAAAYRAFVVRWRDAGVSSRIASGPLAMELLLGQEWLELLRRDPHCHGAACRWIGPRFKPRRCSGQRALRTPWRPS